MLHRLLEGAPLASTKHQAKIFSSIESAALFFFLGAIVVLVKMLILIIAFWRYIKPAQTMKVSRQNKEKQACNDLWSGNLHTISCFDYHTLKKATGNFHSDNLLGKGGVGPVYRGKLADGRLIAVKKLALEKSMQGESEFISEVRLITSIQHKNLVRLLGCCIDGCQRLLVYEYMKNRSLDLKVYGNSDQFLNWNTRFQIILGVGRGLQYLHEDSNVRIVHRDIKASNILLDDKFQPRIGEFGLARFFPEGQSNLSATFAGTLGYTAPEYAIRGELSEKADIYSFGVLVLEIISCRKNTDLNLPPEMQYLPDYAWKLYGRSKIVDLVDRKLIERGTVEKDVLHTFHIALLCLHRHADLRPHMSDIVAMLTCKAFVERRRGMEDDCSWDSISNAFLSPMPSDSPLISPRPNRGDFMLSISF